MFTYGNRFDPEPSWRVHLPPAESVRFAGHENVTESPDESLLKEILQRSDWAVDTPLCRFLISPRRHVSLPVPDRIVIDRASKDPPGGSTGCSSSPNAESMWFVAAGSKPMTMFTAPTLRSEENTS